jgi:beta-glucosidase
VAASTSASADGSIALRSIDYRAQEDARLLEWRGSGKAAVTLNTFTSVDLSRETNGDVLLVMTLQLRGVPDAPVWFDMGCGEGCEGRVRIDTDLAALPTGTWLRVGVPLNVGTTAPEAPPTRTSASIPGRLAVAVRAWTRTTGSARMRVCPDAAANVGTTAPDAPPTRTSASS